MNNTIPFNFKNHEIRVVLDENGEPLFVAKDVALALEYKDPTNAIKQHCKGVVNHHPIIDSLGRTQQARVIHEPDLYRLIVKSALPSAVEFEKVIFEEILPSIRKTGSYSVSHQHVSSYKIDRDMYNDEVMAEVDTIKQLGEKMGLPNRQVREMMAGHTSRMMNIDISSLLPDENNYIDPASKRDKKYREKNKAKIAAKKKAKYEKGKLELSDTYIKHLLTQNSDLYASDITQEIVDAKRLSILLLRAAQEKRKASQRLLLN